MIELKRQFLIYYQQLEQIKHETLNNIFSMTSEQVEQTFDKIIGISDKMEDLYDRIKDGNGD